ncbi:MAG: PhzF family phenazine biosynthesis protein, partial [Saprospiraceae bacterium]|nr:PhzF family phenazine biosynthesis protein [Saprospiraceae bacterium]
EQSVRKYQPDFDAIKKLNARGVIITARASAVYDVVSRCFFPRYGINEDPVTGSAHTLLAPFWSEKLAKNEIVALQASRRSGVVFCTCDANRVHLRGSAVTYLRGEIFL